MSTAAVSFAGVDYEINRSTILQNISFELAAGEHLAIIGPNGAGKTTLIRLLLGLEKPSQGRVQLYGKGPGDLPPKKLGYVPQRKHFEIRFPARVEEFIVSGLRQSWPWRIRPAERDQVAEQLASLGIGHLQTQSLSSLSGGELQRAYLARALVRNPDLIVLDEPAAGMDMSAEAQLHHHLLHYQKRTDATVVLITHDWEGARLHASQVLLLNREVIAFDKPEIAAKEARLLEVFGHTGHKRDSHGGHSHD